MENYNFKVNRAQKSGFITGFTLAGRDVYESGDAAAYCFSFCSAQGKDKAYITFSDRYIIFVHEGLVVSEADPKLGVLGVHGGGTIMFDITPEESAALNNLLQQKGRYSGASFSVKLEKLWGQRGFTLYTTANPEE